MAWSNNQDGQPYQKSLSKTEVDILECIPVISSSLTTTVKTSPTNPTTIQQSTYESNTDDNFDNACTNNVNLTILSYDLAVINSN